MLGEKVTVAVDRPLGSVHPDHPELVYPVNYGYIPGTVAADGEEQDAYLLGITEPVALFTGTVVAVVHRLDDIEDKWVVAPAGMVFSREEIEEQLWFQEQYFEHEIEMGQDGTAIGTERLLLCPACMDYAGLCADFYKRNAHFLAEFEPERDEGFYGREYHRMVLLEEIADRKEGKAASFYLFRKGYPDLLIGKASLSNLVYGAFCSGFLGYKLDEAYINRGYMTEAVGAIVRYAFGKLGLHRIEANVMPKNVRSLRVLEKCGFVNEGTARRYLKINGVWEDHVHMAVLNEEMG